MSNEAGQIREALLSLYKQNQRKTLDKEIHFVPIDLNSITLSLQNAITLDEDSGFYVTTFENFRQEIINYVEVNFSAKILLSGSRTLAKIADKSKVNPSTDELISTYTPAVVYRGSWSNPVGLLFVSFDSTKKNLFTDFLNKTMSKYLTDVVKVWSSSEDLELTQTDITRERKGSEKTFNVGHIFGEDLASTPLQLKIKRLLDALGTVGTGGQITIDIGGNPQTFTIPKGKNLTNITAGVNALYKNLQNQSTLGATIDVSLDKKLKGFLSSISANIVVIQDSYENQRVYADLLETKTWQRIKDLLTKITFSRSLVDEIVYAYTSTIQGIKIPVGSASKKLSTIKTSKTSKNRTVTDSPSLKIKLKTTGKPTFTNNLINLQNLINLSLVERVKANMGTGNRRDILNLRTGRFAESVRVERMSQSRDGMITAFYSYMKNPYATFSQGGKQSVPKSRDPKLLIARSIREIATQQVSSRLRSVSL